jgi:hypothetical protein
VCADGGAVRGDGVGRAEDWVEDVGMGILCTVTVIASNCLYAVIFREWMIVRLAFG